MVCMWSYPRNLPFCYPPPHFKIGKGNLKKDCHKRELLGYPRPPLLTLALFTHFLVSQGSESREGAQNYHFIYIKM